MKTFKLAVVISSLLIISAAAQSAYPSYYAQNVFGLTSPGAMKYGLYGFNNPALLSSVDQADMLFRWSDRNGNWNDFNFWGLFLALPHVGFDIINQKIPGASVTDYKLSVAGGGPVFSYGLGYGWSSGNLSVFGRSQLFTLGTLLRPNKYLSIGLVGNLPASGDNEGMVDLAARPLGNEMIAFFGDYVFKNNRNPFDIKWSAGAAVEALPGVRITGRYYDTKIFNVGVELSLGRIGFSADSHYDESGNHNFNVYGIRLGAYDRNVISGLEKNNDYVQLNLYGPLKYQRYRFFDNSNTLLQLLADIKAAGDDNSVAGIAINTSGMRINREMLWELRDALVRFKEKGKHVIVFIDNCGIEGYDLASAADKIVMDPQGMLTLQGFLFGRQYYKGTLEKLGIGFHEWRYFKYKSAMETLSKDKMSRADSTQWQQLIDDFYDTAKNDICAGRNISPGKFDELVNTQSIFLPHDALKSGLADSLGRWDQVKKTAKELEGGEENFISAGSLAKFNLPNDNYWGEKPKIAVIYAIGECAMDQGITARKLVNDVEAASNDPDVKGVVLRVDSPGGDPLASDVIAEAIKQCNAKKPVIVSQGFVAGSGGYWLSMYGSKILASPYTITGSIGVIGGWIYNMGFDSKLGVSTDFVKRGEHADLGFGFTFPVLGMTLPDRDLTPQEQAKAESSIKTMYNEFVAKVAAGRHKSASYIDSIGQGRVWSGEAGVKNGLVDQIGGLSEAVELAAAKAGLNGKIYETVEYPEPGLINFDAFMPKFFGLNSGTNDLIRQLKFRLINNGRPMPMMPLEDMGFIDYYRGE